jgi:hypothetical protein
MLTLLTVATWLGGAGVAIAADTNPPVASADQRQPEAAASALGTWQPPPFEGALQWQPLARQQSVPQQPALQPFGQQPYATFPLTIAIGPSGYFEVTPAGSLVLYPAWTSVPEVMQTILAMMGPTSLVGRRGFYQVARNGEVTFFLPPGSMPGMFAPTGYGFQPVAPPYGMPGRVYGLYGMPNPYNMAR